MVDGPGFRARMARDDAVRPTLTPEDAKKLDDLIQQTKDGKLSEEDLAKELEKFKKAAKPKEEDL